VSSSDTGPSGHVDRREHVHASLRAAHDRATQRLAGLEGTLDAIIDASAHANLDDEHDPEGATVGFERAQVTALVDATESRLRELDDALERLRLGTYGACARCGRDIPAARLEALPATHFCVDCARWSDQ
jgi:RNA polymerase-binding transcription factor DksA